jgi:hypothetical protein
LVSSTSSHFRQANAELAHRRRVRTPTKAATHRATSAFKVMVADPTALLRPKTGIERKSGKKSDFSLEFGLMDFPRPFIWGPTICGHGFKGCTP